MSYSSEVLADSPLAYWRLGESSGTTITDSSGNSRTGSYVGSPTLGVTGLLTGDSNTAIQLTAGVAKYGTIPSASWMNVSALTVECWANITSGQNSGWGDPLVAHADGGTWAWLLNRDNNSTSQYVFSVCASSGTSVSAKGTAPATPRHFVGTWDGTTVSLYINGSLVATATSPGTVLGGTSQNIDIGRYWGTTASIPGGVLDEVAIYGTVLSPARIAAHYAAGTSTSTAASGTASLSLTASGGTGATGAGTAALSLTASGGTSAAAAGSAALSLSASGTLTPPSPASGAATLSLTASGAASGSPGGTASLNLVATGTALTAAIASGTATLTLTASGSAVMSAGGTVVLTLTAGGVALALYETDTSNALDGLDLLLTADVIWIVPVVAPPASVSAMKYDKAIAYPTPTMVGGRPT